jgi:[acyl-carrier-protein] S-malonyltransferase
MTHAHFPGSSSARGAGGIVADVAVVGGVPIPVDEVDAREARLRGGRLASALPVAGTSEGRQLRRWLTQLIVTERVVAVESAARGVSTDGAPGEDDLLPDITARLEIGSIAAAALADPGARALFGCVTADVDVSDDDIATYHDRNPLRFGGSRSKGDGWRAPAVTIPPLAEVGPMIAEHLRAAARRLISAGPNWCGCRPATSIPATRVNPTTPTGTEPRC